MKKLLAVGVAACAVVGSLVFVGAGTALADPSASDWASLRQCESSGDYSINTGNGYYGAYQFDIPTWQSVGGQGLPSDATEKEQDYRALYLYRMRGWSPWICASLAGLKQDSSGGSHKAPTYGDSAYISGGTSNFTEPDTSACKVGSSTAPPWGGVNFTEGNTYRDMICFQKQLGHLGYGLSGSGYFGSHTLAALHKFEADKHLAITNVVTMSVWVAAWGKSGGVKPGVSTTPAKAPTSKPTSSKPTSSKPSSSKPSKPVSGEDALWPGISASYCHVGAAKAPAWPNESWTMNDSSKMLACWQMQMNHRGYTKLHGNGYYGSHTLAAAKSIQDANHLGGSGLIGPRTWKAAWEGKVSV